MEMEVFAVKQKINIAPNFVKKIYKLKELRKAVKNKYYVINLLPLTNKTKNIFNKKIFMSMKKTSFFVNVGRGDTVNENDLLNALKRKNFCGAALDVMVQEPIKDDSPFLKQKNVIFTPHIAGVTNKYWLDQYLLFSKNLVRYKKGLKLINVKNSFNLEEGY
jgi:phosphoglycerate dehydrogenase-like enzyme